MTRARLRLSIIFVFLALPIWADDLPSAVVLSGESRALAQALTDIRKNLADKKWSEAIEQLQNLVDKGDDLISVGPRRSIQGRRLAHLLLAALPAEALATYRNRVESQARRVLEQGLEQHDPRLLRKVVDAYFCSRPAEKALGTLGDLAFERGDFDAAQSWWRLLLPPDPARAQRPSDPALSDLHYPSPTIDLARLRAKLLLIRLFRDGAPTLAPDLASFSEKHGSARGSLAGTTGTYPDILRRLAAARPPPVLDLPWSTFGGAATRGLIAPAPVNITDRLGELCRQPRWRFSLEDHKRLNTYYIPFTGKPITAARAARSLAFHPVIAGGHVIVADARFVTAYDPRTGASAEWFDAARANGGIKPDLQLPAPADLRYTLTAADDCVYARLGEQAIGSVEEGPPRFGARARSKPESLLVCLGLQPGPGGGRLRWQLRPGIANDAALFEGAPLVHNGLLFIAATRQLLGRSVTAVHCYAAGTVGAPPLRWRTEICEAPEAGAASGEAKRYRHHLLTAAGPYVVYCTHSGIVAALDASTGRRVWAIRYPPRPAPTRPDEQPPLTDLCPSLFADGLLYLAPADTDRFFCLDALSGRLVWERTGSNVLHLLGVSRAVAANPRVIFTTTTGLRAINALDGSDEDGWAQPSSGTLAPMGRGLLLGDLVLWPTVNGVFMIRQADGQVADNPTLIRNVPPGNLAYGQGCLAVADRLQLSIFTPPAWRLPERKEQSSVQPASADTYLELARSQADAKDFIGALATLDQAEKISSADRSTALRMRHAILFDHAAQASQAEADCLLEQASVAPFPARLRLDALKRRADLAQQRADWAAEAAVWQGILADKTLREHTWVDGVSLASVVALDHLARLRPNHGAGLLQEQEKAAQALLASSQSLPLPARQEQLERLTDIYPHTQAARTALRELALGYRKANRPGSAAHAYRRLLAVRASNRAQEAEDWINLADAYEQQRCWEAARNIWQSLESKYGSIRLSDPGKLPVGEYAADRLRAQDPAAMAPSRGTLFPLARNWNHSLDAGETLLPKQSPECVYTVRADADPSGGGLLVCRPIVTGEPRWRCRLPFVPNWLGLHADTIMVAGPRGLAFIQAAEGRCLWQLQWERAQFPPQPEHAFQLRSGRLFVLLGHRRLLAYEAESGRLLWSQWAPGGALGTAFPDGRFHPGFHVMDETVLVQTSTGRRWLLDAATGRLLHDAPTDHASWPRVVVDPIPGDGTVPCLIREAGRIVRLDPTTAAVLWSFALPRDVQLTGKPIQLRVTPAGILVLIPVNRGQILQRLDAATGKSLWGHGAPVFATDSLNLSAGSLDRRAIYLVREQTLLALALADGKVIWEQYLDGPRGAWRTLLLPGQSPPDALLVYPEAVSTQVCRFSWLLGSLQWIVGSAPEAQFGQGCPVHCYDPASGQVIQRLNLAAGLPRLHYPHSVQLDGTCALPTLSTVTISHPTDLSLRVAGRCSGGLVVALAGQMWGFGPWPPPERSGSD